MSRRGGLDVVVVGAGVVGSTAALALAEAGLRVAIVEAHLPPAWSTETADLRVYAFAPDSRMLLERIGVWPAVVSGRVQPFRRMRVWDAAGGEEIVFDADAFGRDDLGHIVEHALLVDRLWAALCRHPGVERHCPAKLRGIEQGVDGVRLTLDDDTELRARLVVGADGASSRVRALAGLDTTARNYGQRGVVAYVRTQLPHQDTCWQRFLPGGPLAFLPFTDGRSSIVWTLPDAEAERLLAVDEQTFCAELTRAFDARLGEVTGVSPRLAFPLRRQLAAQMKDRVVLVGDAAHVVHPLAGQGVNLGLRDVAALAASVGDAQARRRDFSAPHRLRRWARIRESENALATHSFEAINGLFSNDALLPTLARGHLLGLAGRIPPLLQAFWKRAAGL